MSVRVMEVHRCGGHPGQDTRLCRVLFGERQWCDPKLRQSLGRGQDVLECDVESEV